MSNRLRAWRHKIYWRGWLRPLKISRDLNRQATVNDFLGPRMDVRLRAFVLASVQAFPDFDWVITSLRRYDSGAHGAEFISGIDFRSRTWTLEQLTAYRNWTLFWWESNPPMIDVVIEDERYDPEYKGKPPHIHLEVDRPYWRER